MPGLRKSDLRAELARALEAALATAEQAYATAHEGATHAESKSEGDKDTRATEQSYIARGQAMRVEELRTGLVDLDKMTSKAFGGDDKIASGALVTVEDEDGEAHRYFVAPCGGGTALAGGRVQVVTPKSPLGAALCGKVDGDEIAVAIGGRSRELTITNVE